MRIGLLTCRELPEPDADAAPLEGALCVAGCDAARIAWDAPDALDAAAACDLCVLRSTWNYYQAPRAFLDWTDAVSDRSRLVNPADVVRSTCHKQYLFALQQRGLPIVPTEMIRRGDRAALSELAGRRGWQAVVVKPAVSAGSFQTRRFAPGHIDRGQAFLDRLCAQHDVLVQQYLPSVEQGGERVAVWIAGEWTHVVQKTARFAEDAECVLPAAPLTDAERTRADAAIAPWRERLAYARVDLIADAAGEPLISEVELIEPSLFFDLAPPAALARFVGAVRQQASAVVP